MMLYERTFVQTPPQTHSLHCGQRISIYKPEPTLPETHLKGTAFPDISNPIISPNNPKTELKISITNIFTNLQTN
jgi:hypothetical protein